MIPVSVVPIIWFKEHCFGFTGGSKAEENLGRIQVGLRGNTGASCYSVVNRIRFQKHNPKSFLPLVSLDSKCTRHCTHITMLVYRTGLYLHEKGYTTEWVLVSDCSFRTLSQLPPKLAETSRSEFEH